MDPFDAQLLRAVQRGLPLLREPFATLAEALDSSAEFVLDRLRALGGPDGVIREISGIFDAAALGYSQVLTALRVPPEHVDAAGRTVAEHPGVSHCYGRTGRYNLWLTLATSPRSALGIEATAAALADRCGATAKMILPTQKRYKLHVQFPLEGTATPDEPARVKAPRPGPPTDEQVRAIRALQIDLPLQSDPFSILAEHAAMPADALLAHAADFLAAGWMRRYAAVLRHRQAGAEANVLVVWRVVPAGADDAGAQCASVPAVSHCYLRPAGPDWPYTLYTMIHGATRRHCRQTISDIAAATGLADYAELWTAKEYKKQRIRLFTDSEQVWESSCR